MEKMSVNSPSRESDPSCLSKELPDNDENMKIPAVEFITDIEKYLNDYEGGAEAAYKDLTVLLSKYRFMEQNMLKKKERLKKQLPEIRASLDALHKLKEHNEEKKEMEVTFLLSSNVYLKAQVPPTNKVGLWLGANVMLEYTLDEAEKLLSDNIKGISEALKKTDEDLTFLKKQTTTLEVTVARVHNRNVINVKNNQK